ncbi:TIGR03088 family PEP-CTERM/XrtA system glycosyltransferase [Niveibacterium sp. 24ML]|uniref:TIGR03088 family PEP-CTERM/XrtA system glycosyltransferase n=1 Tax=Niveibacterium sp. 24ML TaxID=2985512 RepID=UPI00226ED40C|nr:TIGR03088 family PEP-CTERM/XrtA system glycosyltransferase [Niveibacterium sp. 24ML]MCX9156876.1 TIGR03088 family PEP-CTERM/XrtA system glycosyltransferase [Niveibacterium sp. 24ML]
MAPLIAHIVFSFKVGGLENGMVNLINRLPHDRYRHAIISLTDVDPAFVARIARRDLEVIELHKPPGPGVREFPKVFQTLRRLRPAVVHTRNLAALEMSVPAWAAGVAVRVHGEHGRDVDDPDGSRAKPRWVRRAYSPFVTHYIALSRELKNYLTERVGIAQGRVSLLCNGVDSVRFAPAAGPRVGLSGSPFNDPSLFVIGTVGRLQAVKDQVGLVRAFARLASSHTAARLVIAGEGGSRAAIEAEVRAHDLGDRVWLAGERADVPDVMRSFDLFALPSIAEGISNTVLEAMASGLPVVATDVGGNPELVVAGTCGDLVPAQDPVALADALAAYAGDRVRTREHGRAGRARIESAFSLDAMVAGYDQLYSRLLA